MINWIHYVTNGKKSFENFEEPMYNELCTNILYQGYETVLFY